MLQFSIWRLRLRCRSNEVGLRSCFSRFDVGYELDRIVSAVFDDTSAAFVEKGLDVVRDRVVREEGVEGVSGAGSRGPISMPGDLCRIDVERTGTPCEHFDESLVLHVGDDLLVEVALHRDEEVTGRVVGGAGVSDGVPSSALVDVSVGVDEEVVGDIGPAEFGALVVRLVPTGEPGRKGVVLDERTRVMHGDSLDVVKSERAGGRNSTPGIPANDLYLLPRRHRGCGG